MHPIFQILVSGQVSEVRVGDAVFPVHDASEAVAELEGPSVTSQRVNVVEAPLEIGTLHGWVRRQDLERVRKAHYQRLGAAAADAMRQADEEGAQRQAAAAALEAEHQAAEAASSALPTPNAQPADVEVSADQPAPAPAPSSQPTQGGKQKRK